MKTLSDKDQDCISEDVSEILNILASGVLAQQSEAGGSTRDALAAGKRVRKALDRICKAAGAFPVHI